AAAEMLANGKILGWVQGRMEFGPRALGARSILADPRDPEMNAKVNNAVKFREWWRPFAPSMLAEVAGEYIESATDSPFMILTAQVKPEKRSVIPSVTHVDGSARPQTVERDVNPLYWRLIREFGNRTGVPVVMNTSFNLRGEPIVSTPTDAVRTFFSSGMDALVIGSFVVEK
ncbi:MAG TPA: carbamoyltransferase C-terminal domain-containing protein, partial [Candidatus Acidoferrales bacterium]